MNTREKWMVAAAVAAVLSLVIYRGAVKPVTVFHAKKLRAVEVKTELLAKMERMATEYRSLERHLASGAGRGAVRDEDFNLFSFLEKVAGGAGLKERIGYMKPSTLAPDPSGTVKRAVEMKLQGVGMEDLVIFLHGVEGSKEPVTIQTLSILKSGDTGETLTVIVKCESVESVNSERDA